MFATNRHEARIWYADWEETEDNALFYFPAALDFDSYMTALTGTVAPAVSAMSDCGLLAVDGGPWLVNQDAPAFGTETAAQQGALFLSCTPPDDQAVIVVPGLRSDLLLADGVTIDETAPDVAALIAALLSTSPAAMVNPFDAALQEYAAGWLRWVPVEPEPKG
jgi:hypothetical protein